MIYIWTNVIIIGYWTYNQGHEIVEAWHWFGLSLIILVYVILTALTALNNIYHANFDALWSFSIGLR